MSLRLLTPTYALVTKDAATQHGAMRGSSPDKRYRNVAYDGARRTNMERYTIAKLCRDDLESSGDGDGVEI